MIKKKYSIKKEIHNRIEHGECTLYENIGGQEKSTNNQ